MKGRTLLVVSARLDATARDAVASGLWPRKDFFALAAALDADVIDYGILDGRRRWRILGRVLGVPRTQALIAFTRRGRYDHIFTDGEHIGLPLALLLRLSARAPRHVSIGHLLTTRAKRAVFRWLGPASRLDAILLHASLQQRLAVQHLGLPDSRLPLIPYQADTEFWRPVAVNEPEAMACSAGLEYRDYPTLLGAAEGLPLRVVIAAGSRWSRHKDAASGKPLPANVEVTSLDYTGLRDLYARARFVVVPLHNVDNQAGVTTIIEAMAMGKAVIVTATPGQRDVVRGRLYTAAGVEGEPLGGPQAFGITGPLADAETGLYVPPGDVGALRTAMTYLLHHSDHAGRMGRAGRRLVEAEMSLDRFVERVSALIVGDGQQPAGSAPLRMGQLQASPSRHYDAVSRRGE